MEPIYLRHKDAKNQAIMYGAFAALVWLIVAVMFVTDAPGKWWFLVLVLPALFLTYSTLRLATLRVRLDTDGIWEPNPFRLTYATPWADVQRVRRGQEKGSMKLRFLTVEIVHRDGTFHDLVALKIQGGAAHAEPQVTQWVETIREAKRTWG